MHTHTNIYLNSSRYKIRIKMDTLVQRKKNQAGTNRIQTKRTKFGNEKRRKKIMCFERYF